MLPSTLETNWPASSPGVPFGDLLRRRAPARLLRDVHHRARIDAQEIGDEHDHDSADAEPAADHAHAAAVLDIVAGALVAESHGVRRSGTCS